MPRKTAANGATPAVNLEKGDTKKRYSDVHGAVNDHGAKRPRIEERTDYARWRMRDDESRHTWHYLESDEELKAWPQTAADKYFLGLPLVGDKSPLGPPTPC